MILFFAASTFAATTNGLSDAQLEGRTLAQQLCNERPGTNTTFTGTLKIRDAEGKHRTMPVTFTTSVTSTNWLTTYQAGSGTNTETLSIIHNGENSTAFQIDGRTLGGGEMMTPFAGSDFWAVDLGLEFFHWPGQEVLKHEMRRGRSCKVLESTNPNSSPGGYSRVDSWIDNESGGIVHAEAYDAAGKLLKEFDPKSFKKVNGQWELEDMEIRNDQTGSRTRIEFDLDEK
jgi:hypothetical protein